MNYLTVDEMRILATHAHVFIKMLKQRETRIFDSIYGEFRNGNLDHTARLAEFCSVRALINEIITAIRSHEQGE